MTFLDLYFTKDEEFRRKYGDKTILFLQNGKFFELYGLIDSYDEVLKTPNYNREYGIGRSLDDISLKLTPKPKCRYNDKDVFMSGPPVSQLDKYKRNFVNLGYVVVFGYQEDDETDPTGKKKKREKFEVFSNAINDITYSPTDTTSNVSATTSTFFGCISFYPKQKISIRDQIIDIYFTCTNLQTGEIFGTSIIIKNPHQPDNWNILNETLYKYPCSEIALYVSENSQILSLPFFKTTNYILYDVPSKFSIPKSRLFFENVFKTRNIPFLTSYQGENGMSHSLYELLNHIRERCMRLLNHMKQPKEIKNTRDVHLINFPLNQLNILPSGLFNDLSKSHSKKHRSLFDLMNNHKTSMGKREFLHILRSPTYDSDELRLKYNKISSLLSLESGKYKDIHNMMTSIIDIQLFYNKLYHKLPSYTELFMYVQSLKKIKAINAAVSKILKKSWFPHSRIHEICDSIINRVENTFMFEDDDKIILNPGVCSEFDDVCLDMKNLDENIDTVVQYLHSSVLTSRPGCTVSYHENTASFEVTKLRYEKYIKPILRKPGFSNISLKNRQDEETILCFNSHRVRKLKSSTVGVYFPGIFEPNQKKDLQDKMDELMKIELSNIVNYIIAIKDSDVLTKFISELDNICNCCSFIDEYNYTIPVIMDTDDDISCMECVGIRHPLIEQLDMGVNYVPNDVSFNDENAGILLYGVNESGKSSLMKAIGMNLIMAQCGLPVACSSFRYVPYHKIATRVQSQDNIWLGQSTFNVEIQELSQILRSADKHTFIMADELCSGTENVSANVIVLSTLNLLYNKKSHYLFTTHLHKLKDHPSLRDYESLHLYDMPIERDPSKPNIIYYPHKLQKSVSLRLYGTMVARASGLPSEFIQVMDKIETEFTKTHNNRQKCSYNNRLTLTKCAVCKKDTENLQTDHIIEQHTATNNTIVNHHGVKMNMNNVSNLVGVCSECHNKKTQGLLSWKWVNTSKGRELIITNHTQKDDNDDIIENMIIENPTMTPTEISKNINKRLTKRISRSKIERKRREIALRQFEYKPSL